MDGPLSPPSPPCPNRLFPPLLNSPGPTPAIPEYPAVGSALRVSGLLPSRPVVVRFRTGARVPACRASMARARRRREAADVPHGVTNPGDALQLKSRCSFVPCRGASELANDPGCRSSRQRCCVRYTPCGSFCSVEPCRTPCNTPRGGCCAVADGDVAPVAVMPNETAAARATRSSGH